MSDPPGAAGRSFRARGLRGRILRKTMNTDLHIGNISLETSESNLKELFTPIGRVLEVRLVLQRTPRQQRGFAFVTMATAQAAATAIETLNGAILKGHFITVKEAHSN